MPSYFLSRSQYIHVSILFIFKKNIYIYMYVCGYGSWRTNVLYWTFRFMALPWPTFMVRQGQPSISSFDDLPPIYIWLLGTEVLPLPPTIHTYRHIRIRIYIYIYLFMCIYIYMYAYMCMYIRMDHKDMHAYTHKHTLHTYIHTYIHTYMHTSRLWYTHSRYIHMSMHVYRYAY